MSIAFIVYSSMKKKKKKKKNNASFFFVFLFFLDFKIFIIDCNSNWSISQNLQQMKHM